jgi:hypothetical protein
MALSTEFLCLQVRRLAAPTFSRSLRPMVSVRSVATKVPEIADYNIEEKVSGT